MNAYDTYKMYLSLKLHFTTEKYDYHQYGGAVSASVASFEKRSREHRHFLRISRTRDPEAFIVGNMLFGSEQWIGAFSATHLNEFEKYRDNGSYHFKGDLDKLKPSFGDNFIVDPNNSVPYILRLLMNKKISLFTACVFEQLLKCDSKWRTTDNYMVFSTLSQKIKKAAPFFKIDSAKYRAIATEAFRSEA